MTALVPTTPGVGVTAALGPAPAHVEWVALEPGTPRVQLETMALAPAPARVEPAASAPAKPKG